MEDGKGVLEDGTRYVRESGEDFGPNGFWKRWTRLAGVSAQGKARPCPAKHAEMQQNAPLQAWMPSLYALGCWPFSCSWFVASLLLRLVSTAGTCKSDAHAHVGAKQFCGI